MDVEAQVADYVGSERGVCSLDTPDAAVKAAAGGRTSIKIQVCIYIFSCIFHLFLVYSRRFIYISIHTFSYIDTLLCGPQVGEHQFISNLIVQVYFRF